MAHASIMNDVIGPIMRGPSSSHTAGAYRIAKLACDLAGEDVRTIRCTFDPSGSYAPTYQPLGVDLAFAAGCMDWDMTDNRYRDALQAAKENGLSISFHTEPLSLADHPNAVRIEMTLGSGDSREVWAKSTGGGIVEVYRVDDWEISLDGRCWSVMLLLKSKEPDTFQAVVEQVLGQSVVWRKDGQSGGFLVQADATRRIPPEAIERLRALDAVEDVRLVEPVLFAQPGTSLFQSAARMIEMAEEGGLTLGEVACRYESVLLELPEASVLSEMAVRYDVMRKAVEAGQDDAQSDLSFCDPSAASVLAADARGQLPLGGILTRAAARSMACMHICNSKGVVCAAPTGGAAGVVAGTLVTMELEQEASDEVLTRALLAAGAVGLIMAERATFAAETAGCQVEIGVAGAMAAAAVVEAAGGSARHACDAAAIALQNTMGSVCDSVGGGCEIPCHTRNAVAASSAFVCADLVMGGYRNPISLDDTIDASYEVGRALPRELRCTALGGLATTPSALKLVEEAQNKGK